MSKDTLYSVHPAVEHARAIIQNLTHTTGRSMDQWCTLLQTQPQDQKLRMAWLKDQHEVGAVTARLIVGQSLGQAREDRDPDAYLDGAGRLVEAMYAGKKSALRPIYEGLIQAACKLPELRISPCKTMVPLYRNHVFAEIKPATLKRVDLGLALKGCDRAMPDRLIDTGGLARKDRITHRFALTAVDQIDPEIEAWLGIAWGLDR